MFGQIDWVSLTVGATLGALLGAAFPFIWSSLRFVVADLILRRARDVLEGPWHAYHFTRRDGSIRLRHEIWFIRRNWRSRMVVSTEDPESPNLKYTGLVVRENDEIFVTLSGVAHKERDLYRFHKWIPDADVLYALNLGVDLNNRPMCVLYLLTREPLTDSRAREALRKKTHIKDHVVLGISEENVLDASPAHGSTKA